MANGAADTVAMLDAWRERGADRVKPVRFRMIEAIARRAACQTGEVRRLLDERIARLIHAYAEELENAAPGASGYRAPNTASPRSPGALAELVDWIATSRAQSGRSNLAIDERQRPARFDPEPEALDYFRQTWAKLSAERQLRQSHERVPGNAGPLNSESLVYRSLSLMHELSPEYLRQFLSYVDALSWMEQLNEKSGSAAKETAPSAAAKKSVRGKSR